MKFVLSVLAVLITFCSASAVSGVPGSLTYQGRLLDSSGVPVPDGAYLIQFRLYDAPTAGRELWNSSFRQIEITNGLFSYNLGDTVAIRSDLFSTITDMFLGIKIGTEAELLPRIRLTSSGFAFQALISDSAQNAMMLEGQPAGFYLDWNNLANIPAGFADGVDDSGGSADWPTITNIPAGFADGVDDTASSIDWTALTNTPAGFADGVDNDGGIDQVRADGRYVNDTGDVVTGDIVFQNPSGFTSLQLLNASDGGEIRLGNPANNVQAILTGRGWGELDLYSENGLLGAGLLSLNTTGGWLELIDPSGITTHRLRASVVGDASVIIPDNAINSLEILDEPGIARDLASTGVVLTTTMQDISTVTVTIPRPGYIFVMGRCYVRVSRSSNPGEYQQTFQIDETEGGGALQGLSVFSSSSIASAVIQHSVYVDRAYFKPAGTYTFRLEGELSTANGGHMTVGGGSVTALFFPTSYGSVTTVAGQPGDHPEAKQVTVTGPDGSVSTAYEMDLRYYEEKARVAKIAKQKAELAEATAELELARAKATAESK